MADEQQQQHPGFVPAGPDPTPRTLDSLQREVAFLKELVFTRLDGMDKALALFQENLTKFPTDTDKQVHTLRELHEERFRSMDTRFAEVAARATQTEDYSEKAISSALAAADKTVIALNSSSSLAIAKSEAATQKAIEQLQEQVRTAISTINGKIDSVIAGIDGKINDLKDRVTGGENRIVGQVTSQTSQQGSVGMWVGIAGAALAIISFMFMMNKAPEQQGPIIVDRPVVSGGLPSTTMVPVR